jgi:hypothetical protein
MPANVSSSHRWYVACTRKRQADIAVFDIRRQLPGFRPRMKLLLASFHAPQLVAILVARVTSAALGQRASCR